MTTQEDAGVPGWPDALLQGVTQTNFGLGAESDLPEPLRFLLGVVRVTIARQRELSRERASQSVEGEPLPAIFFLSPTVPANIDAGSVREVPMLDNGLTAIGGRFWFVGPTSARGYEFKLKSWPDDGLVFNKATNNLGIGNIPAVVVEPRTESPQIRHYRNGLANPDDLEVVSLRSEVIDIERILAVVDQAHANHLVTPQPAAGSQLWKNRMKHWPVKDAERRIQFILRVALQGAFPATVVREEQSQPSGRLDLEIEERRGEGATIKHALLELKVLRSYGSTGKRVPKNAVAEAIKEGVRQAHIYRDERGVLTSALCCFDMRTAVAGEECFVPIRSEAKQRKVRLRTWHIFASAKEFRATYR